MTAPPQVLVVETDGSHATQLGGPGEGPGEFAGVESVVPLPGDSLAVWDPERRRISVFDATGPLLREVDLREVAPLSWIASPNVTATSARTELWATGRTGFWLFSVGVMGPGEGAFRPGAPSYRVAGDGSVLAELAFQAGDEAFSSEQFGAIPNPLGAISQGAVVGQSLAVSSGSEPELQVFGPEGGLIRLIRWSEAELDLEPGALPVWESFLEEHLATLPEEEAGFRREALATIPAREELPAVGQVVAASGGELWVGPYVPGQHVLVRAFMGEVPIPATRWLVFGVDGELAATVRIPGGFTVYAVDSDRVWGVYRDDLDVESVRAYAFSGA
ncbi:MAG: hypothetical protein HKN73_12640 [Gemmatimonadetes bacterium]|nr:hypothetical protein [Gemmatimonadota bacterium]